MADLEKNESLFTEARLLIEEVRSRQALSSQTLKGRPGLATSQRLAIRATAVSYVIAGKPPPIASRDAIRLLERFEEMARRQKMMVDAGLRLKVLNLLVTELWVNRHSLHMEPAKLLAATAYRGAIGTKLFKEFRQFSETPGIFRYAVTNYPADPENFLLRSQQMIEDISRDEEFAEFRETPGIFKQAVTRNPSDPRKFLNTVKNIIRTLAKDEEFEEFRHVPGIFKLAAVSNLSAPEEYLRKAKKAVAELTADPEFSGFHKTPGIFLQAVTRFPSDPHGFLKKVKTDIETMAKEKEFTEFLKSPHILQYAALHNTSNPRGFLRQSPTALWHAMLVKNRKAHARETPPQKPQDPKAAPRKPKK